MVGGLLLELSPGLNFVRAKFRVLSILPFYRVTIHVLVSDHPLVGNHPRDGREPSLAVVT